MIQHNMNKVENPVEILVSSAASDPQSPHPTNVPIALTPFKS